MNSACHIMNQWGGAFLSFAGAMLWQSSLLVLVLLVLDFGLHHRVRASVRHGLWLVLLVKLVLPTSLAAPTSPAWWWSRLAPVPLPAPQVPSANFTITHEDLPMPEVLLPQVAEPVPVRPALTPAAWSLLAAGAVSLALLGWLLLRWRQVVHLSRAAIPSAGLNLRLGEARELAKFDSSVPVKLTHDTMSPAVCGLFRPVILLPHSLAETLTPDQLRAVLLHELMHVRRGDVWVNFAQSLLQIAYWWHPLVWLANARLRRIREEAVDDAVMVALRADAEIYAPTLLAVAKFALQRPLASLGLVGILESRSALRQRIERLVNLPVPRRAGLGVLSALGIVAFSAVALPMGEAPPLQQPAPEVAPAASKPNSWPDARYDGYRQVNLLAHFLIMDFTALRARVPTLANAPGPVVIPREELDSLLTTLKHGGARYFNNYPGGVAQGGFSGARMHYLIGGGTNASGNISCVTTNAGGRTLITGWDAAMPATQPDWVPVDLTLRPWLADKATRCEFKLTVGGQVQTAPATELLIPSEGALAWMAPTPAQPGKCQVILVMSWDADIRGFPIGFRTRSFPVRIADLQSAWRARGLPEGGEMSPNDMLLDLIYDAGLNWLPPRRLGYDTNGSVEAFAPSEDLALMEAVLTKISQRGPVAKNAAIPTDDPGQIGSLVKDAIVLYDMGKLDEAKTKLSEAQAREPDNPAVKYYLDLINKPRQALSTPGRQAIFHKLESIRLETNSFDGLPLSEVLRRISEQAKIRDPEKQGINFLINPRADLPAPGAFTVDPTTGLPPTAPATTLADQVDVGSTIIKLNLNDVRLVDLLDAIVLVADQPIKYSIQDYAVVFSPNHPELASLHARTFKVSLDTLKQGLGLVGPVAVQAGKSPEVAVLERLRDYLHTHGVDFVPPKTLFYKERLGLLFIKATESDLEKVENTIVILSQSPQGPGEAANLAEPVAPATSGKQTQMRVSNLAVNQVASLGSNFNQPVAATNTGIMSNPKFQAALHAMEQRSGVEKLEEPEVTTHGGHSENRVDLPDIWVNLPAKPAPTNASLAASPPMNLIDRSYEVDPEVFALSLQQDLGQSTPLVKDDMVPALQRLFGRSGVASEAPKFTIYQEVNSRQITLVVKATREDLATFEKLFQKCLINLRSQLHLKSRFIEITGEMPNLPALTNFTQGTTRVAILADGPARKFLHQLEVQPGSMNLAEPEVTTTSGRQTQMRVTTRMSVVSAVNPKALTPPGMTRAEVKTNSFGFFTVEQVEIGPIFDVVPQVMEDGCTIRMGVSATEVGFAGYDQPTKKVRVYVDDLPTNGPPATTTVPAPRFTMTEFRALVKLYDNQTLILSQPVDPRTGQPAEPTGKKSKHLLVMTTATIVDPAGNRVHADDDLPFAQDHVPPAYDASDPPIVDPIILR